MLTKKQYRALCRYRNAVVSVGQDGLSDVDMYLLDQKYIEPAKLDVRNSSGILSVFSSAYKITELGKVALTEYEARWKDRIFQVFLVVLGAVLALLAERLLPLL